MRSFYNMLSRLVDKLDAARNRARVIGGRRNWRRRPTAGEVATGVGIGIFCLAVLIFGGKMLAAKGKAWDEKKKADGVNTLAWFDEVENLRAQGHGDDPAIYQHGYEIAALVAADRKEAQRVDAEFAALLNAARAKYKKEEKDLYADILARRFPSMPKGVVIPEPDAVPPAAKPAPKSDAPTLAPDDQELLNRILDQLDRDAKPNVKPIRMRGVEQKFVNWVEAGRPELSEAEGELFADYCSSVGGGRFYSVPEALELMYDRYQDNMFEQRSLAETALARPGY